MGHRLETAPPAWQGLDPAEAGGILRGIDPRARILAAVAFAVTVVACHGLPALGLALLAALGMMRLACLPVAVTLRRMLAMDGFIVFMLLMLPFTVPGDPLVEIAGFPASRQGLRQAVDIGLKANAVVLALMSLVGSMSSVTLGHALHRLRLPVNLVHLLLFTVRYIAVLHEEYLRLRTAMKARGFRPANSLHTLRSLGYLVGMMLVRALERSERILCAMKCRGFAGHIPLLDDFRLRPRDGVFGLAILALCSLLILLERVHVAAS